MSPADSRRPESSRPITCGLFDASTAREGKSGLGLEAQRQAVEEHLNGGNWQLVAEFTEIESGKRSDRPKLAEALTACRLRGAKLIIAKLDRLARNRCSSSSLWRTGFISRSSVPSKDFLER
jgi:DNA invertase Pin-like site-specific DNA recombinase